MVYVFSSLNRLLQKALVIIVIAPFVLMFVLGYGFKRGLAEYEQWISV